MKPSKNLWPVGIILTFVVFISATVGLVVLASTQHVDLVNSNYYDQEIKYQSRIDSQSRTRELGASASIAYDPASKRIVITLPEDQIRNGIAGHIELYRPSMAGLDRQFDLDLKTSNAQSLDASDLTPGLWKVRVTWTANNQSFFLDQKIIVRADANIANASASH
jgi:nitrogen fixation protein FixH